MPRIKPQESPGTLRVKRPTASWSSGKELVGTDRIHKGWFIDAGLDEALDAAAEAAGFELGQFSHLDGAIRSHWLMPSPCPLYILIAGVPYTRMAALVKADVSYSGLGARWPRGGRSALAFQALHPLLMAVNYLEPLIFTVSSTRSDDLLEALLAHDAVLARCEELAAKRGRPRTFEFWEVALPLTAGAKVVRGSGDKTSAVYPILSGHADHPTAEELRKLLAPKVIADVVTERWAEITAWAADFARAAAPPRVQEEVVDELGGNDRYGRH